MWIVASLQSSESTLMNLRTVVANNSRVVQAHELDSYNSKSMIDKDLKLERLIVRENDSNCKLNKTCSSLPYLQVRSTGPLWISFTWDLKNSDDFGIEGGLAIRESSCTNHKARGKCGLMGPNSSKISR